MTSLDPPSPPSAGTAPAPAAEFAPDPATMARLDAAAREGAGSLLAIDIHDPVFDVRIDQLIAIGRRDVEALAAQASRSVARSSDSERAVFAVHDSLANLRSIVERLDPGAGDALLKPRRLFGLFPVGEQLTAYFDRYRDAQDSIESALANLAMGRDKLLQDNVGIDADRRTTRQLLGALSEAIYLCGALDARFVKLAGQLDARDPAKARRIRDGALFHVRQRHSDLLTQMAVSLQGYQVLGIVRANNIELAKGIDRASATTIAALRTAIVAAQALSSQRLLLDRIAGVNVAATSAIAAAAEPLAAGNARLAHEGAAATGQLAALQRAFADVYATVDAADSAQAASIAGIRAAGKRLALESR